MHAASTTCSTRGSSGSFDAISLAPAARAGKNDRMHVGMASIFQNPGRPRPDHDVYREELRLADLAEPLGFDSVWSVEHHFTDYTMCPDVLQFLTGKSSNSYAAGNCKGVGLDGSPPTCSPRS